MILPIKGTNRVEIYQDPLIGIDWYDLQNLFRSQCALVNSNSAFAQRKCVKARGTCRSTRQMVACTALSIPLFLTRDWRGIVDDLQSLSCQDYPAAERDGSSTRLSQLLGTDERVLLRRMMMFLRLTYLSLLRDVSLLIYCNAVPLKNYVLRYRLCSIRWKIASPRRRTIA